MTSSELIKKTAYDLGMVAIQDRWVEQHIKKAATRKKRPLEENRESKPDQS